MARRANFNFLKKGLKMLNGPHIIFQIQRREKLQKFLASIPENLRARRDYARTEKPKTSLQFSLAKILPQGIICYRVRPDYYKDENGNLISLL